MTEDIIFPRKENNAKTAVCSSDIYVPEKGKEANDGEDNRTETAK